MSRKKIFDTFCDNCKMNCKELANKSLRFNCFINQNSQEVVRDTFEGLVGETEQQISSLEKELEELRKYISDKSDMLGVLKEFTKTRLAKMVDSDESLLSEFDDIFNSYKINRDKELRDVKKELEESRKIAREACVVVKFYANIGSWVGATIEDEDIYKWDAGIDYVEDVGGKTACQFLAREDVKKFLEGGIK